MAPVLTKFFPFPCFLMLIFLGSLPVSRLSAAPLKKILILGFKNTAKDRNHDFLEGTITKAVRQNLVKKFAFYDTPPEETLKFAEANMLSPDDFHTQSVGFQMGLLMKQDVVISGGFIVKGGNIVASVTIFDIGQRKVINRFEIAGPASSDIFNTIGKIADRIAGEVAVILPNKEEWQKSEAKDSGVGGKILLNKVSVAGNLNFAAAPGGSSTAINTNRVLDPADMPGSFAFSLGYDREKIIADFFAWGSISYHMGKREFQEPQNGSNVSVSLQGGVLRAGIGYELPLVWRIYLAPNIGAGYYWGIIKLNYSNLMPKPLNLVTGLEEENKTLGVSAVVASAGLRLGLHLNHYAGLEITAEYWNLFYSHRMAGIFFVGAAMTFRVG